jgi:hypothetical protein
MRYLFIFGMCVFYTFFYLVQTGQARPVKRYDERTKMCRFLADGRLDWESEPWGTGGIKFREVCKSCHHRNNNKGATFIHAESYTSKAWNSIFTKRRKKCARDGSWDVLSEDELQMVNDYLYRNGDWTYDPNSADSCG